MSNWIRAERELYLSYIVNDDQRSNRNRTLVKSRFLSEIESLCREISFLSKFFGFILTIVLFNIFFCYEY